MKFKKNWKRFWTLNRHHAEGFTLVELIVVIAILAILGGVAVPAYSGYVEKAERAADEALLAEVNTAFAAACAIKGESHIGRSDVDNQSISDGELVYTGPNATEFGTFYEGGKFKVFNELYYDKVLGGFAENAIHTFMYNGNPITVSSAAINALKNSTYGSVIGGEALLKEISELTGLIGNGIDATSLFANEDFMRSFASYMGVEDADTLEYNPEGGGPLNDAIDAIMDDPNAGPNTMINAMVYYAAEKSTEMDRTEISTLLTSGNIYDNLSKDQPTKLAQASMAYGLYTSFVNSEYNTVGATSTSSDPMAAIQAISGNNETSNAFNTYMNSAQGRADLDAYMAAMNVINSSTGNEATKDVLVNGFDDPELIDLLVQAIGK